VEVAVEIPRRPLRGRVDAAGVRVGRVVRATPDDPPRARPHRLVNVAGGGGIRRGRRRPRVRRGVVEATRVGVGRHGDRGTSPPQTIILEPVTPRYGSCGPWGRSSWMSPSRCPSGVVAPAGIDAGQADPAPDDHPGARPHRHVGLTGRGRIRGVRRRPVLEAVGDRSVNEGATLTFIVSATDPRYVWQMDGTATMASSYLRPISLAWTIQGWATSTRTASRRSLWRHTGERSTWQMDGTTTTKSSYLLPISRAWQIQGLGEPARLHDRHRTRTSGPSPRCDSPRRPCRVRSPVKRPTGFLPRKASNCRSFVLRPELPIAVHVADPPSASGIRPRPMERPH